MLVKFNKSGKVALNYGIDGIIEVEKDEVRDLHRAQAFQLLDAGIVVEAEAKPDVKEIIEAETSVNGHEYDAGLDVIQVDPDVEKPAPKKRGRKPKVK